MKILICIPDIELAQIIFAYTMEAVKEVGIPGEVSNNCNYELLKQQLVENQFEYDVFALDALDRKCQEMARFIRKRNLIASIIFVADNAKKIPNIMIHRPSALITKTDNSKQMKDAVLWTYKELITVKPYFTVKNKEAIIRVNYMDILWFESRQRTVILHGKKQEIVFYAKLSEVYELIPREMFLRCHQSYIVNCNMIECIDKTRKCISLTNGKKIEISKSYYQDVISFANQN